MRHLTLGGGGGVGWRPGNQGQVGHGAGGPLLPAQLPKSLGEADRGLACPGNFLERSSVQNKEIACEWRRILPSSDILDMVATTRVLERALLGTKGNRSRSGPRLEMKEPRA